MAKKFSDRFYHSKEWKACRKSFIALRVTIDGGMCQHCKQELGYIVDHAVELNPDNINDPDIALNNKNLQFLCLACHNTKTFSKYSPLREDVMFNESGELVQKI